MSTPTAARDWKQIVADSKGTMHFVPSALNEDAKNWQGKRVEFQKEVNRIAKTENEIGLAFNKLIFDIRTYLAENGVENVWTADIGFNTEALKDGVFILNITKAERQ